MRLRNVSNPSKKDTLGNQVICLIGRKVLYQMTILLVLIVTIFATKVIILTTKNYLRNYQKTNEIDGYRSKSEWRQLLHLADFRKAVIGGCTHFLIHCLTLNKKIKKKQYYENLHFIRRVLEFRVSPRFC